MNYLCQRHIIGDKRQNQRFSKIVISISFIHKTLGEILCHINTKENH